MSTLNVSNLASVRREYPNWNTRARIRKVDEAGNLVQGQYAYGGEVVRVSPRYQKNGANFRIRPERPAVFFATWCFEKGLLTTLLTPAECEQEDVLQALDTLWEGYKGYFPKLESPFAACDLSTQPSLRTGFSFTIAQVLVEAMGIVKAMPGTSTVSVPGPNAGLSDIADALKQKVEQMRARTSTGSSAPPSPKAKK